MKKALLKLSLFIIISLAAMPLKLSAVTVVVTPTVQASNIIFSNIAPRTAKGLKEWK